MQRYIFVTYGEEGWRGVQMRAIRMAQHLPKDEVMFWECDDPKFIRSFGFKVTKTQAELLDPAEVRFPKGVDIIIFSDLPSNLFFNYAVYIAALKQQKKVVICEQLYRKGQMGEEVFRQFSLQSDLFLLNGLSSFKDEEEGSVKLIPPQIELSLTPEMREETRKKYGVGPDTFLIFGAGYHKGVKEKIEKLSQELAKKHYDCRILLSGSKGRGLSTKGNVTYLPFQSGDEYFKLLHASDATLVKFGFLQILESLALHKPTIVLGEGGYVLRTPEILDRSLRRVLCFDDDSTTIPYVERLITKSSYRSKVKRSLMKLHDGSLFGAREAAVHIKRLRRKSVHHTFAKKKVAILINDEVIEKEEWLKKQRRMYPICFVLPFPAFPSRKPRLPQWTSEIPVEGLNNDVDEILPHSFKHIFLFSKRKLDGLIDIMPWYEEWVHQIRHILQTADAIYVTKNGQKLLRSLLHSGNIAEKVRLIEEKDI